MKSEKSACVFKHIQFDHWNLLVVLKFTHCYFVAYLLINYCSSTTQYLCLSCSFFLWVYFFFPLICYRFVLNLIANPSSYYWYETCFIIPSDVSLHVFDDWSWTNEAELITAWSVHTIEDWQFETSFQLFELSLNLTPRSNFLHKES